MAEQTKELSFAEALDVAGEQAVEEFDGIEVVDDNTFNVVDEDAVADVTEEELGEPESQESEDIQAEETEGNVDEGVVVADEEIVEARKSFEETGNPEDLPDELQGSYKLMQGGFTKKMQELGEQQRQYNDLILQAKAQQEEALKAVKAANVKPRPDNPTESMSFDEQQKRWDDISKWNGQEAVREMVESGALPDPDRVTRQLDEQERQAAGMRRYNMIAAKEGFSEQVDAAMLQLSQANQYWANAIQTDEGAEACFEYVKTQLSAADFKSKAAELENAKVKRSADAAKRQTPKPATQTKAVVSTPVDNFADMAFEDQIESTIRESFNL